MTFSISRTIEYFSTCFWFLIFVNFRIWFSLSFFRSWIKILIKPNRQTESFCMLVDFEARTLVPRQLFYHSSFFLCHSIVRRGEIQAVQICQRYNRLNCTVRYNCIWLLIYKFKNCLFLRRKQNKIVFIRVIYPILRNRTQTCNQDLRQERIRKSIYCVSFLFDLSYFCSTFHYCYTRSSMKFHILPRHHLQWDHLGQNCS